MKKRLGFLFRCVAAVACAAWVAAGAPGQVRAAGESPLLLQDAQVRRAVERELASVPAVSAHLVTVEVSNGIVALLGRIDNLLAKEQAARIAETVKGVRAVENRIQGRPPPWSWFKTPLPATPTWTPRTSWSKPRTALYAFSGRSKTNCKTH